MDFLHVRKERLPLSWVVPENKDEALNYELTCKKLNQDPDPETLSKILGNREAFLTVHHLRNGLSYTTMRFEDGSFIETPKVWMGIKKEYDLRNNFLGYRPVLEDIFTREKPNVRGLDVSVLPGAGVNGQERTHLSKDYASEGHHTKFYANIVPPYNGMGYAELNVVLGKKGIFLRELKDFTSQEDVSAIESYFSKQVNFHWETLYPGIRGERPGSYSLDLCYTIPEDGTKTDRIGMKFDQEGTLVSMYFSSNAKGINTELPKEITDLIRGWGRTVELKPDDLEVPIIGKFLFGVDITKYALQEKTIDYVVDQIKNKKTLDLKAFSFIQNKDI